MGSVRPSTYIFGILVFTLFFVASISLFSETFSDDPAKLDNERYTSFNNSFNKLNDVTTQVDNLENNILDADTDPGLFGVLNSLIQSSWQSLRLITSSFGFMGTAFEGLTSEFGVPSFVITLIIAMITILIIFAIYSAIFQREI